LTLGWLIPRLPAAWGVPLGVLATLLAFGVLVRALGRALPGELHLLRAWLGLRARRAPAAYVRRLFDSYAARYDRHLMADLDYRVPNLLRDLVGESSAEVGPIVADLGCGTGVLAPLFRGLAGRLEGVDLSPGMLARAARRGLYDELVEADLVAFLAARPGRYDLLLAADVLPYLGDPGPLLTIAARALRPDGRLALSAERREGSPFSLTPTGRFAHDPEALAAAATAAGLALEAWRPATLRREAGRPVAGFVMLLRKSCP
jgi:predicted TPR repeat methyltransferase